MHSVCTYINAEEHAWHAAIEPEGLHRRSSASTKLSVHGSPQAFQDGKENSLIEGACQVSSMIPAACPSFPIALLQLHVFILQRKQLPRIALISQAMLMGHQMLKNSIFLTRHSKSVDRQAE